LVLLGLPLLRLLTFLAVRGFCGRETDIMLVNWEEGVDILYGLLQLVFVLQLLQMEFSPGVCLTVCFEFEDGRGRAQLGLSRTASLLAAVLDINVHSCAAWASLLLGLSLNSRVHARQLAVLCGHPFSAYTVRKQVETGSGALDA